MYKDVNIFFDEKTYAKIIIGDKDGRRENKY